MLIFKNPKNLKNPRNNLPKALSWSRLSSVEQFFKTTS